MKLKKLLGVVVISSAVIFTTIACGQGAKSEAKYISPVTQEQKTISLKFKPVTVEDNIVSITKDEIIEIFKQYDFGDNKYIIFTKREDTENLHSGVIISKKIYDLGKASIMGDKDNTDLYSVKELELYGKKLVKISSILGANYASTNYYYIDNQVPKLFLHSEGYTRETDLDGDGIQEIVASTSFGVTSSADIYKYENGSFTVTNLNEALNAITVYPTKTDKKVFEAYFKDQTDHIKHYEYIKQGLKELN